MTEVTASPIWHKEFLHDGVTKYQVSIDCFEEYDPGTETAGVYQARIWVGGVGGDCVDLEYHPSEEAAARWLMEEVGATVLTPQRCFQCRREWSL